jgi:hypothetical protein
LVAMLLGGKDRGRLLLVGLLAVFAALALAPGAQASCAICDEYTLDIPDPKGGKGGDGDIPTSDPAPEPPPAPAAPPPAPVEVAPAPASEAVTDDAEPRKRKPKRAEPVEIRRWIRPAPAPGLISTPLRFEQSQSAPEAALAGLGQPGTLALLGLLAAAGTAIAVGRRRGTGSRT